MGRGIAEQIALASRVSPSVGSQRLELARVLWAELPETQALLAAGAISEALAARIAGQTGHLDAETRRLVDKQLAGDGLDEMGLRKGEAAAKRRAYEADRAGYTARGRKARGDRRVTLRPAPDTMAWLTLLLPVEQGAAAYAALRRHADGVCGVGDEERTRDQVMADTAVERLTGQARAQDVDVEVNLVIPWDALTTDHPGDGEPGDGDHVDGESVGGAGTDIPAPRAPAPAAARPAGTGWGSGTAEVLGHGPIPIGIARDILASSRGRLWWRRLFTAPATDSNGGALIGGDPRRRRFDGFLAHLLRLRDGGTCRDPYCDAPIRHLDHIHQARTGGPSSLNNGRGVCARGNYAREMPDWHLEVIHDGLGDQPHTTRTTTPTGHTYTSRAGPAP